MTRTYRPSSAALKKSSGNREQKELVRCVVFCCSVFRCLALRCVALSFAALWCVALHGANVEKYQIFIMII
jgi:hypothetical protein